jgi:hypothetical protein
MTTTTSTTDNNWIPLLKTYTGTKDQPDVATVFFKSDANEVHTKDEQKTNELGYSPCELGSARLRIEKAAKILFKEMKQGTFFKENSESWNAFKNLSRGIIQLFPLLGNGILYIHDLARIHFSTHPKLKSALSNQVDPVVGLAFDGVPVFTVPFSVFQSNYPNSARTPNETTSLLVCIWGNSKLRAINNCSQLTTRELAEKMRQVLVNPQRST